MHILYFKLFCFVVVVFSFHSNAYKTGQRKCNKTKINVTNRVFCNMTSAGGGGVILTHVGVIG